VPEEEEVAPRPQSAVGVCGVSPDMPRPESSLEVARARSPPVPEQVTWRPLTPGICGVSPEMLRPDPPLEVATRARSPPLVPEERAVADEGLEATLDVSASLEDQGSPVLGRSPSPGAVNDASSKAAQWREKSLWAAAEQQGEGLISLEEAFELHSYNFDTHRDGTIGMEEILILLERCNFFDSFMTVRKVRVYLLTMQMGCNHLAGIGPQSLKNCLAHPDFERLLRWLADMKSVPFEKCVARVVALSAQLCDKSSSVVRKLEVLFETYGQQHPGRLTKFEFAHLCSKGSIYEKGKFCTGDAHTLFQRFPGGAQGVDFSGFLAVVAEVGRYLEVGPKVFLKFGAHCDSLKADDSIMQRLRMRMRNTAQTIAGRDWEAFFLEQDDNDSGSLSWAEFHQMCRQKLHMADHDNNLRTLFNRLDEDLSGEISIEELIDFVADAHEKLERGHRDYDRRVSDFSAGFEVDMSQRTWQRLPPKDPGSTQALPGQTAAVSC